jgi:protein involved in polysaccharide export with SLBB domain
MPGGSGTASTGNMPTAAGDANTAAGDGGTSGMNSDNGGDSASDSASSAAFNPAVGLDTAGHVDAVATRNGRTTRRRRGTPVNPLVITNPLRGNGPGTSSDTDGNQTLPLISTREPGDYTLQTDPFQMGRRRNAKPLPLFGYDFFQPARQIITARRRALLPRPIRRPVQPTTRNRANRTGAGLNSGGVGTNGYANPTDNPNLGAGYPASAAAVLARRGTNIDPNSIDPNSIDPNSIDPNSSVGQNGLDSLGYSDPVGQSGMNQSGMNQSGSDQTGRETPPIDGNGIGDTGQSGDQSVGRTPRRQSANTPETADPNGYSYGFPGDTNAPGSDIQFPGDDALVLNSQNGTDAAANAVGGEIADPVSTLYKNVLASLPPNYQLQPGDSLAIRYSALTLAPREFNAVVDAQGGIDVEGVGRIAVAGRTAAQAETTLTQRLARLYRKVDVSISLRQLRTIQVTVSGSAFAPGTYTVPASATAFNVLNAAGGPTANGSLRDIRVLRGGRLAGILDIYPLIGATTGSPSAKHGDVNLQAGDNIYIPARLSRITVRGEVRQPAVYELTPTETLGDALNYSGGVKPSGVDQTVHIDTVNAGTGRVLRDVNLRDKKAVALVPIYDGDSVEVASVRAILTNRVTVAGAVDQPGDFALTPGMRVLDLLQRARGPLYDAYLDRAELTRLNSDNTTTIQTVNIAKALDGDPTQNIALKRFDNLRLYSRQEVAYLGRRVATVRGAVQRPGLYTQSDNMRISDLLLGSGGPLPDAYLNRAVLLHQRGDGTYAYDYLDLHGVLSGDSEEDKPILDNDILAVYRIGEAHFTPDHTVKVLGDVVAPGLYARGDEMRLSELLKLAGAFKPGGGTRVTVAHARQPNTALPTLVGGTTVAYSTAGVTVLGTDALLQDGDVVAVQGNGSLKDHPSVVTVTGAVSRPGPIIISSTMHLTDAIREAGGLRPEAFPQGAEFTRTSESLVTAGQSSLAKIINQMSDMLNLSQYQRERAKANLALIEAAGSAASGSSSSFAIPGISPSSGAAAANPNIAPLVSNLSQTNPVSPGRLLTPSQLQPNGGVAVRLTEALKRPGGREDFLLKDGDTLVVPETPTTVQVVGAVFNARGVLYQPGQSIDYYIQHAGDYTPDAAKDRIEVIHAGGGLIPASKAGGLQPGDLILVPTKVLAEKVGRSGSAFSDFFQGLLGSAVTFKVLSSVFGL